MLTSPCSRIRFQHYDLKGKLSSLFVLKVEQYVPKCLVYSILWSFAGDAKMKVI